MTIGSSYNYAAERATELLATGALATSHEWLGRFPGPPDLCFNYRKLVDNSLPIARMPNTSHRIAIIGAGIAGIVAARELYRCGFTDITLIEAGNRIAGRHHTKFVDNTEEYAPFEMGAMRMPFFNLNTEQPLDGQSLMAYYAKQAGLATANFPNPGTKATHSTGIYLKEGLLVGNKPEMLMWVNSGDNPPPPTLILETVYNKWKKFEKMMVDVVSVKYGTTEWPAMWDKIVAHYENQSFRQMVLAPAIGAWSASDSGNFGGLGLTPDESEIFYAIGFGDGSWGAFYDVCALYPIRTAIFGFGSNLQLIPGRFHDNSEFNPGPFFGNPDMVDSGGRRFERPRYKGLRALAESLMYIPPDNMERSLYQHLVGSGPGRLFTSCNVELIQRLNNGQIRLELDFDNPSGSNVADYDSVIVTVPSWIMEVNSPLRDFPTSMMPYNVHRAYKTAHWESSCKVYVPIKASFFDELNLHKIPTNIVSDTFIHDVYIYKYGFGNYKFPCALISYTWEDDANKFLSFTDAEIAALCVRELDRLLRNSGNILRGISNYIEIEKAQVQRWFNSRESMGCAKLYRPGAYGEAMRLLAYNRRFSAKSNIYLAGESFSVDAGWTEPSFRGALDAVINLCNNTGATFNNGFSMDIYPHFSAPD